MKYITNYLQIILLIISSIGYAQNSQQEEKIIEINYIFTQNKFESSAYNIKSTTEYLAQYTYNSLIFSEILSVDSDIQTKRYHLSIDAIKKNGIIIKSSDQMISIMFSERGYEPIYIKYSIQKPNGSTTTGIEQRVNLYFSDISLKNIHKLTILLEQLFENSTYSYTENKQSEYNYYSEKDEDIIDSSYFSDYYNDDYNSGEYNEESTTKDESINSDYYSNYEYNNEYSSDYIDDVKQDKITYYDEDGNGVYSSDQAYYFRIVYYDEDGILVAADYKKDSILFREAQITHYDTDNRNNDIINGSCIWYYKSGEPKFLAFYKDNILIKNEYLEIDENSFITKIMDEDFDNNTNNWLLGNLKDNSTYLSKGSLHIESKNEYTVPSFIKYKINTGNDFIIESTMKLKYGNSDYGYGIIWGFKNWGNYHYFKISSDGHYRIETHFDGLKIKHSEGWKSSDFIRKDFSWNKLQINKYDNKLIFSINGNIIESIDFLDFLGNRIGFIVGPNREIEIDNLKIIQKIGESNNNSNSEGSSRNSTKFKGNGSGFFINRNGYIATNYHVIKEAEGIVVEFIYQGQIREFNAKIIQSDKLNDLAIIKIADNSFSSTPPIPYNFKIEVLDVGSQVFALGYPMALSGMGTEVKFTDGKISSKTGYDGDITTYQMTTPIQPGNSGGPLFDYNGNLIGINSAKFSQKDVENVSYAIKNSYLNTLIEALPFYLDLPTNSYIANQSLTEKIKTFSPFVVLIKIK